MTDTISVLIVDDQRSVRMFLRNILEGMGYRVFESAHGKEGLEVFCRERPDLVLTDLEMPEMGGLAFIAELNDRYINVPIIVVSGKGTLQDAIEAVHRGAWDYLIKPVKDEGMLEIALNRALERSRLLSENLSYRKSLEQQVLAKTDELRQSNNELLLAYDTTIEGWSRALDFRDKETEGHSRRVTDLTLCIARELGMDEEKLVHVRRGALLHDIGKLGVPDSILLKPDHLTDDEFFIMMRHTEIAYSILSPIEFLRPALEIPYCHHEKWDGSGYPRGLKGEEIPLTARIFAIVDVWDALCSDRPYRAAWPQEKALAHIRAQAGTHFDPVVVRVFDRVVSSTANKVKENNDESG